ncbi:MAG TPA: SsrA-binding protein SmpB [Nitrospirae bacterium]|nr:SsrA-binding protein SmpB [Nitrospirota bacterium]
MKDVARNKKAYYDYNIEETYEAGIALLGTEAKSLREGKANLKEAYVLVRDGEAVLLNCHISPYSHGSTHSELEPTRTRKLLLHKKEIERIGSKAALKGYTLLPLKIYFKGSRAKVLVGLGKGKRFFEKRDTIKEREARVEIQRALKDRNQ